VFIDQRYASLHPFQVITSVCLISRLGKIWEALNQAIEALAITRPDWLLSVSLPHWYECYGYQQRNLNLRAEGLENNALAQAIGADGFYLLDAVSNSNLPELMDLSELIKLRLVWSEQFEWANGKIVWQRDTCSGCSSLAPAYCV
jgi:transposase